GGFDQPAVSPLQAALSLDLQPMLLRQRVLAARQILLQPRGALPQIEQRAHLGAKHLGLEGPDDVVNSADLIRFVRTLLPRSAGEEEDGDVAGARPGTDDRRGLEAI